jgi:carbamoyl-phosphate synthase large subunit
MVLQLRQAMQRNDALSGGKLIVASSDVLTPAGCFADATEQVPLIKSPDYVDHLLSVCRKHDVRIIVPLIDLDLERLAPHLDAFAAIGTTVVCPPPGIVDLCFDKSRFAEFCLANALEHSPFYSAETLVSAPFPLFYKRQRGFGSIGSGICQSRTDAEQLLRDAPDTLFQDLIRATEISVDAYISRQGECIVCVPRSRDKVVAGEAYKSRTMAPGPVSELARRTIEALARAGLRGPLNIQIFVTDPPSLIEVNTRLGSASVLSNMAVNGRLFDAVLAEACGETATGDPDDYSVGLGLTRFLGDVFHQGSQVTAILPR